LSKHRVAASGDVEVSTYLQIAEEKLAERPASEEAPSQGPETIVVMDFGSQYSMLIVRRVRECKVYCELVPHDTPWEKIASLNPKGFILSGGPASVYETDAPLAPSYVYDKGIPVLGICYGMQAIVHQLGGEVASGTEREYGNALLHQTGDSSLFAYLPFSVQVWMSHGDQILSLPPGFTSLGYTDTSPYAVIGNDSNIFGLQFHPEVVHTPRGKTILENFLYNICGCQGNWTPGNFITDSVDNIRRQVGKGKVICALSGGVDSAVAATLVHRAIGDQLTCIFVNNALLRHGEAERVLDLFQRNLRMNVIYVDATERFLQRLKDITDPEKKRMVIGEEFIRVFEDEASKIGTVDFLVQGTLYPDVIESTTKDMKSARRIKAHHNVGGLPEDMALDLLEPLRHLFKDEVREIGLALGLPEDMIWRQPFPGPGLAVRIIGDVTAEKLEILRAADVIVVGEMKAADLYREIWQGFAVLTDVRSVGVME
jgi:GMP synthase (glutamine-hydrolysing)